MGRSLWQMIIGRGGGGRRRPVGIAVRVGLLACLVAAAVAVLGVSLPAAAAQPRTATATSHGGRLGGPISGKTLARRSATIKWQALPATTPTSTRDYVPGKVIVRYRQGTTALQRTEAMSAADATGTKALWPSLGLYVLSLDTSTASPTRAIAALDAQPDVLFAEPDYIYHTMDLTPANAVSVNDPSFPQQWGLKNIGQWDGTAGDDVDASDAWGDTMGASKVVVAVIDTGVDYNNPDMKNSMWSKPGTGAPGYNFVAGTSDPMDDNGHGTVCAGEIAAQANNGVGVAGVAPNVKIMALKVFDSSGNEPGADDDAIIAAIKYATTNGASEISMSLGGSEADASMYTAIQAFGGPCICAAGNDGDNGDPVDYPGAFCGTTSYNGQSFPALNNVIGVGATDTNDALASFSEYSPTWVSVDAPGVAIASTAMHEYNLEEPTLLSGADWGNWGVIDLSGSSPDIWQAGTGFITGDAASSDTASAKIWDNPGYQDGDALLYYDTQPIDLTSVPAADHPAITFNTVFNVVPFGMASGNSGGLFAVYSTDGVNWAEVPGENTQWNDGSSLWPSTTPDVEEVDLTPLCGKDVLFGFAFDSVGGATDSNMYVAINNVSDGLCSSTATYQTPVRFMQGTSQATPIAAGICALMMSANTKLSPLEVKQDLIASVTKRTALAADCVAGGVVNAFKAVQLVSQRYTLSYSAGPGGKISGTSPQSVQYAYSGTPVTAIANPGYTFVNWSDGSTANPRTDSNVMSNISVTANFKATPAQITSFTPTSGAVGATVTLTGSGFTDASKVTFNGVSAAFTVKSDTQIMATVPSGATSGAIAVTTPGGTATSAASFTVIPAPTISGFTPTSGTVGATVTLSGTGFTGASKVTFNGVSATFTVNSATQISATVPSGATSGKITVTTPGGTATSAASFTVVVNPKLTLKLSGLKSGVLKLGKRLTAKGTVKPASLAGSKVQLTVQHKLRGKWRKVKSVARTISASGTYGWKYKPAKKGSYRIRATIAKTVTNTAATTTWHRFKVK
jgi:subtilisin family serine protease